MKVRALGIAPTALEKGEETMLDEEMAPWSLY